MSFRRAVLLLGGGLIVFAAAAYAAAQEKTTQSKPDTKKRGSTVTQRQQFVYLIRPIRPGFNEGLTKEEEEIMGRHFNYLKDLTERKEAILVGPCLDAAFGICIFEAESEEAARKIMENDPSVKEKVMTAELHAFKVSLMRKND